MSTPRIDALDNVPVKLSYIDAPNTLVQNRAQMVDLANDLSAHFGISERVMVQEIYPIRNEQGPNGEAVWGAVNDELGRFRFWGNWSNINGVEGTYPFMPNDNLGAVEFTFYGTGVNMLATLFNSGVVSWFVSVDGGGETDVFDPTWDETLRNRNTNANQVVKLASGLSLGIHTVRIRSAGTTPSHRIAGFEVLNESSQVRVNPGALSNGKTLTAHVSDFDGGFDVETGTDVGAGGSVLYYEEGGSIKKAVNWGEDNQLNLTSANHANEDIIEVHNFREFGGNRADSPAEIQTSTTSKAYTLDDSHTSLVGEQIFAGVGEETISNTTSGSDYISFQFVGTGLDIVRKDNTNNTIVQIDVFLDEDATGTAIGSLDTTASTSLRVEKIVSGLPYGSHVVRFKRTASGLDNMGIRDFIVYGPAKPTLPANAVPLHEYYLVADYVDSNTAGVIDIMSEGVIRKDWATREGIYRGSASGPSISVSGGFGGFATTLNSSDELELTFWGTGFEFRFGPTSSSSLTVELDGSTDFSGFTTNFVTVSGNPTWTPGTGVITTGGFFHGPADELSVTGLSLGFHTLKLTSTSGSWKIDAVDIITPTHAHAIAGPKVIQNALRIGSQSIGDLRRLSAKPQPGSAAARATQAHSTGATTARPMLDQTVTVNSDGREYLLKFNATMFSSSGPGPVQRIHMFVNGVEVQNRHSFQIRDTSETVNVAMTRTVYLPEGRHTIQMQWETSSGTVTQFDNSPNLEVLPVAKE